MDHFRTNKSWWFVAELPTKGDVSGEEGMSLALKSYDAHDEHKKKANWECGDVETVATKSPGIGSTPGYLVRFRDQILNT